MRILAIHPGAHDASAAAFEDYRLVAAVQEDRITRRRGSGDGVPWLAIDEVLRVADWTRHDVDAIASTRAFFPLGYLKPTLVKEIDYAFRRRRGEDLELRELWRECQRRRTTDALSVFAAERFLWLNGFRPDTLIHFADHHAAHALPALFFTDWPDALIVTADGMGENTSYSIRSLRDGVLDCHHGDDAVLLRRKPGANSLGHAWAFATKICGLRPMRDEGRLVGLAASGKPDLAPAIADMFPLGEDGLVTPRFTGEAALGEKLEEICGCRSREVVAASIQKATEDVIGALVRHWLDRTGTRRLGLSGGLFANPTLNRVLADTCAVDEVFVFPAMGDEGLSVGAALSFLLARDGLAPWLAGRYRLDTLSLGRDCGDAIDGELMRHEGLRRVPAPIDSAVAQRLTAGEVGAVVLGRAEFGPHPLGARCVIASPARIEINDTINKRLERADSMALSAAVHAQQADGVFALGDLNRYAARFMTMTAPVRPEWVRRIPAIVHIDGTARLHVARDEDDPVFAAILHKFRASTGLPALVSTAFALRDEPPVHRPAEAARALLDARVDFIVTQTGVYERTS